jgi:hypothetical protein
VRGERFKSCGSAARFKDNPGGEQTENQHLLLAVQKLFVRKSGILNIHKNENFEKGFEFSKGP